MAKPDPLQFVKNYSSKLLKTYGEHCPVVSQVWIVVFLLLLPLLPPSTTSSYFLLSPTPYLLPP